jgi:hypothetical protein
MKQLRTPGLSPNLNEVLQTMRESLVSFLKKHPKLLNTLRFILSKGYLIFLDYPINPEPRYGYGKPPHPMLYEIINRNRMIYQNHLTSFLKFKDYLLKIPKFKPANNPTEPFWSNKWLSPLDAVALYSFLSLNNPKYYIEIGSGNSTKFARRAVNDHHLQTKIISIDPEPRAEIDSICDDNIHQPLENINLDIFHQLDAGDILFVDSSHSCFTNSDVSVIFLDILPTLNSGVWVHFHDIMLPYDYPPHWQDRYYSEQYLLAAYLLAEGSRLEIVLANAFIDSDIELRNVLSPLWDKPIMSGLQKTLSAVMEGTLQPENSFWLRIK